MNKSSPKFSVGVKILFGALLVSVFAIMHLHNLLFAWIGWYPGALIFLCTLCAMIFGTAGWLLLRDRLFPEQSESTKPLVSTPLGGFFALASFFYAPFFLAVFITCLMAEKGASEYQASDELRTFTAIISFFGLLTICGLYILAKLRLPS